MFHFKNPLIIGSPPFTLIIFMTRGQGRIDVYGTGKGIKILTSENALACQSQNLPAAIYISSVLILLICCRIGKEFSKQFLQWRFSQYITTHYCEQVGCGVFEFIVMDCNESTRRTVKGMFHCKGSPTSTVREKCKVQVEVEVEVQMDFSHITGRLLIIFMRVRLYPLFTLLHGCYGNCAFCDITHSIYECKLVITHVGVMFNHGQGHYRKCSKNSSLQFRK